MTSRKTIGSPLEGEDGLVRDEIALLRQQIKAAEKRALFHRKKWGAAEKEITAKAGEIEDARATLAAWFDLSKQTEEAVTPILLDGLRGYLRTSKSGGMPAKDADTAYSVLEDFCRLYVGNALVPVLRGIAESQLQASNTRLREVEKALASFSVYTVEGEPGVWLSADGRRGCARSNVLINALLRLDAIQRQALSLGEGGGEQNSSSRTSPSVEVFPCDPERSEPSGGEG